jgi:acyl CoA:acetate/3-ketoacid CoA transferase alpha subunit
MRFKKVIEAEDAVAVIRDGDVIASTGYGGNGTPDQLFVALEKRFLETGSPRDLTLVFAGGQGDGAEKGLNHLGHEGLLKRVIGGHFGLIPRIERLSSRTRSRRTTCPKASSPICTGTSRPASPRRCRGSGWERSSIRDLKAPRSTPPPRKTWSA